MQICPVDASQVSVIVQCWHQLESDQTQLLVDVPAISYFPIQTDGKGVLVWFHFLLAAGKLLTGNSWRLCWQLVSLKLEAGKKLVSQGMSAKCPVKSQLILL